jgi:cell division transport system permease protein
MSIRLPFLLEGVISAIIGWAIATGLLALLKSVIDSKVAPLLSFTKFFGWGQVWVSSGYLLATGLFVSVTASVLTLRRYLKV